MHVEGAGNLNIVKAVLFVSDNVGAVSIAVFLHRAPEPVLAGHVNHEYPHRICHDCPVGSGPWVPPGHINFEPTFAELWHHLPQGHVEVSHQHPDIVLDDGFRQLFPVLSQFAWSIKTVVGENQVFKGLELSLKSMKMGERSIFTI